MKDKLIKLHNTLSLIEVKGQNAKLMADCLAFIENAVKELDEQEVEQKVNKA